MRLCFTLQMFICLFQSIQNLCYSTQPVVIFQHIVNIFISELHNRLENRSFFFPFFLKYNPKSSVFHLRLTFWSLLRYLYNEMVTVGKYIETERSGTIANLQEYRTVNCVLILSMRCQFATAMLLFFIYIFQTGFIYKTKIYHLSCRERTIHITWNAMSNTATESSCTLSKQ